MMLKQIFQTLQNNSLIDYDYYHLYNNHNLDLDYTTNGYKKNYIVYILGSDFTIANKFLDTIISNESITDVFLERWLLTSSEKHLLFSSQFKELFWLRLNNLKIDQWDYEDLVGFIYKNSLDINRLFLEESWIKDTFLEKLSETRWFWNLTFMNLDNNSISDTGIEYFLSFLTKNNIDLEYLSLAGNDTSSFWTDQILEYFQISQHLRILDLSMNQVNETSLLDFLQHNTFTKELFLRGITFTNNILDSILQLFESWKTGIYILRFTLTKDQKHYQEVFDDLWKKLWITFDIDLWQEQENKYYSTIYIKWSHGEVYENIKNLNNSSFYNIDTSNIDSEFEKMLIKWDWYFKNGINLFLFDFHDYKKIRYLLETYNFNYIYLENYHISDEDFIFFIQTIASLEAKKYKINLISLEINQFQLDYLIENIPENIFYVEVNLNKIEKKERYIAKMLKNPAFIFENMELYAKIFK